MEKTRIFRSLPVLALLMLCLLLTGCGRSGSAAGAPAGADPAAASAAPEAVHFAAGDVSPTAESVTLRLASGETAQLDRLTLLRTADLSGSENEQEVANWAQAHPGVSTRFTVTLPGGTVLPSETRSVDLSALSVSECEQAAAKLSLLPSLETVNLGAEGKQFSWSDIARLRALLPKPVFQYAFKLYGTDCNLSNTTISLYKVRVPDDGRLVDEIMDYMPQLTYVDMDSCGLPEKRLEEINLRHPNVKVVFRVFFGDITSRASTTATTSSISTSATTRICPTSALSPRCRSSRSRSSPCAISATQAPWPPAPSLSIWRWPTPTATICAPSPASRSCGT